jgi:hypothetical protein
VKYTTGSLSALSITGAIVGSQLASTSSLRAWQPSTWPKAPGKVDPAFLKTLKLIFDESILCEIDNVIEDAQKSNGGLEHRGHVVAIALMCALDATSSYGYGVRNGRQIAPFVRKHFPSCYHPHAEDIRELYRNSLVHSWNLFKAALSPNADPITKSGGILSFGLLDFRDALRSGVTDFLGKLKSDPALQASTLKRYRSLRNSAKV